MTEQDHNALAQKAKELDDKLWELYQLAKDVKAKPHLNEVNKWEALNIIVAELSIIESEFAKMSSEQVKRYNGWDK
jgi:flagellar motility protein MotE (MotC chaperone)